MAEYKIIKLTNMTPLHIGSGKENYDFAATDLQSDSISAALAAVAIQTKRKKADEIKSFLESFRISSAFPYARTDYYYLPRMIGNFNIPKDKSIKYRKELKAIKYLYLSEDKSFWRDMVCGNEFEGIKKIFRPKDQERLENTPKAQTNERVTIDKNGESTPFFFEWSFFKDDGGLFFIVDADAEQFKFIKELFVDLGIIGIGTDKNIGGGKFSVEENIIVLPDIDNANATMLLSTYIPSSEELPKLNLKGNARYELICRGGFVSGSDNATKRHFRKNTVYMFNVGSVFTTTDCLNGTIENLKPNGFEHDVWRSGRPFTIKVKI